MNVQRPGGAPGHAAVRGNAPARAPSADAGEVASAARGSLWEILTSEEREFFSQSEALGPVTYRPGRALPDGPPAPTGRRIDVRG